MRSVPQYGKVEHGERLAVDKTVYLVVMVGIILAMCAVTIPSLFCKKCSACGARNALDAKECARCKARFPDDD